MFLKELFSDPSNFSVFMFSLLSKTVKTTELKTLKIEIIITNEDVKTPKPDPEGYIKAISHFGLDPAEVLIVEDSDKGFQAASESGAHVMRVANATEVTFEKVKSYIESL